MANVRNFRRTLTTTNIAEIADTSIALINQGWTPIAAGGSKLPKGVVCRCRIVGYIRIESPNTNEFLIMYQVEAQVNNHIVSDTVLANERPDALLPVGTERLVENWEQPASGRLLNRFVVNAETVPAAEETIQGMQQAGGVGNTPTLPPVPTRRG